MAWCRWWCHWPCSSITCDATPMPTWRSRPTCNPTRKISACGMPYDPAINLAAHWSARAGQQRAGRRHGCRAYGGAVSAQPRAMAGTWRCAEQSRLLAAQPASAVERTGQTQCALADPPLRRLERCALADRQAVRGTTNRRRARQPGVWRAREPPRPERINRTGVPGHRHA